MSTKLYEIPLDSLDHSGPVVSGVSPRDWPNFLISGKGPIKDIAAFKILEIQFPFTYYVFVTENNTFQLIESGQTAVDIVLPEGNYTAAELETILEDLLNDASILGHTYTVTYSSNTQKFTFKNGVGSTLPFSFQFGTSSDTGVSGDQGNTNPRLYLGFPGGITTSQTFGAGGNSLVAPNVQQVSGPNYIYLNSQKLGPLVSMYLPRGATNLSGGNSGPQVAMIPVNVSPGGIIYWQDPDPDHWFSLENLASLISVDFYLTLGNTTSQKPLRLNGASFSIKIGLQINDSSSVDNTSLGGGRPVKRIRTQ